MITTAGVIIIFALTMVAFIAGLLVGSYNTKRKAEFIGKIKNWETEVEDRYKELKKRM